MGIADRDYMRAPQAASPHGSRAAVNGRANRRSSSATAPRSGAWGLLLLPAAVACVWVSAKQVGAFAAEYFPELLQLCRDGRLTGGLPALWEARPALVTLVVHAMLAVAALAWLGILWRTLRRPRQAALPVALAALVPMGALAVYTKWIQGAVVSWAWLRSLQPGAGTSLELAVARQQMLTEMRQYFDVDDDKLARVSEDVSSVAGGALNDAVRWLGLDFFWGIEWCLLVAFSAYAVLASSLTGYRLLSTERD